MYEITEDASLTYLKSKILKLQNNSSNGFDQTRRYLYSDVNCIGSGHTTNSFKIDGDGSIDLVYKNKMNFDTYKITARFARLTYNIHLERSNINYKHQENDDNLMIRKDVHVIGVTIGDLLKHFYHNNKDKKSIDFVNTNDDENETTESNKENDKMQKLIKKSVSIDTSNAKITNVIGKLVFKKKTIRLWENLVQEKFIDRGENSFIGFCNKIIFLSEGMFYSIYHKDNAVVCNDKYYNNIFNNLSDKTIVTKLLRYHLYNENPEDNLRDRMINYETFYFDHPIPVPEILEQFYKYFNDEEYMKIYRKVMKPLNGGETQDMAKRYSSPTTFKSLQNINDEYPMYAFKNISLKQWKYSDVWELEWHEWDYIRSKKNQKIKYKMQRSDKIIPIEDRFHYDYRYSYLDDMKSKKRKYMKDVIKEGLFNYENSIDDIFY
jgi:hypothetical protein